MPLAKIQELIAYTNQFLFNSFIKINLNILMQQIKTS